MTLTFADRLDHAAVVHAVDQLAGLVRAPEVADAWQRESALPGLTVGGLTRHLVSQPECAVEFLRAEPRDDAVTVSLLDYYGRVDWLTAGINDLENTSIRDGFNAMAAPGPADSVAVLERSRADLTTAMARAHPTTYVPWQDCALPLDDFLVCRLLEIVVHADDLAVSIGHRAPRFDGAVLDPVLGLLAALSARRHGQDATVRALARAERSHGPVSAF
jgi:mycothiol maleylpyruvate isomerase-like protein